MSRADRVAARLAERELDLLLVTDLVNLRYLTGFTGTNGIAVVGPDTRRFLTDFRYVERATGRARRLRPAAGAAGAARGARGGLARGRAAARVRGPARVGAPPRPAARDAARPDRARRRRRARRGGAGGQGAGGARRDPRRGRAGRRGLRLAARAGGSSAGPSARSRSPPSRRCASAARRGPSFPSIVAAAENGALPHATPRDVPIPGGTLVTLDIGARPRRLLLGLHAHVGDGRPPRRPRGALRDGARGAGDRARRGPAGPSAGATSTRSRAT